MANRQPRKGISLYLSEEEAFYLLDCLRERPQGEEMADDLCERLEEKTEKFL